MGVPVLAGHRVQAVDHSFGRRRPLPVPAEKRAVFPSPQRIDALTAPGGRPGAATVATAPRTPAAAAGGQVRDR